MKSKLWIRILAITLALLLGLVAIVAFAVELIASAEAEAVQPSTRYQMHVQVLEDIGALKVDQTIQYTNDTGQQLNALLLRVYPNAFRRQHTAPFEFEQMESAYPQGFTLGGTDFFFLRVDGMDADWGVMGVDESILRVAVDLAPGASCELSMGYEVMLPGCTGFFGVTALGYQLGGFYPSVLPWDASLMEFATFPVSAIGDNLFADPSDFDVTLDAPGDCVLASPGELTLAESGARDIWTIKARGVRVLSMALSRKLRRYDDQTDSGVKLFAYMQDGGSANMALELATKIIGVYEPILGALPTDTIALVQADTPKKREPLSGLIELDTSILAWNARAELEYQLAYSLARQYFSEAVGSNPQREPWLSEALSSYMALRYYKQAYGQARFLDELNQRVFPALHLTLAGGLRVDSEAIQFQTGSEYQIMTQLRGIAAMYEVSLSIGEDAFLTVLRKYVDENRGSIASIADFSRALNEVSGRDLNLLLLEMLQNLSEYINPNADWYE